jgi:hypothetical protein
MSLVGEDRSETRRYTVAEAAEILGVTVEAIRGRIKRGTLTHEKTPDGTVWVFLDADQPRPVVDQLNEQTLLVPRLENEIEFLREELARKDAILLSMSEAMKALLPPAYEEEPPPPAEPPSEPPEAPTAATEQPGRGPQPSVEGPQEEGVQRPWWRRMFDT